LKRHSDKYPAHREQFKNNLKGKQMKTTTLNHVSANAKKSKPMSKNYKTYDTKKLVETVINNLGLDCTIHASGNLPGRKSTKHFVEITLNERFTLPDGIYSPRIIIRNSYAGESALIVQIGLFRFVCSNGLLLGTKTFAQKIRHVGKSEEQVLEELNTSILVAIDKAKDLAWYQYTIMQVKLTYLEAQRKIESLKLPESVSKKVLATFEWPDRPADEGMTIYTLYNIVNEIMRQRSRSEMRQIERNNNLAETLLAA
jgi:hypothetical protein